MMKKTGAFLAGLMALGLVTAGPAEAGRVRFGHSCNRMQLAQYAGDSNGYNQNDNSGSYYISPSQAASIAKGTWPGAKVLRVQLLPSGVYAVTLKQGGEVSRVLVDATSGEVS
jgi:Peptidase propeptide and YPEB domain